VRKPFYSIAVLMNTAQARRTFVVAVMLALGLTGSASSQTFPSKSLTIVVSLAAGTGMDALARIYADKLSQALGKPVVVENEPGAATTLAAAQVASAPADGHTLVVLTSVALSINPTLYKQLSYSPQDFVPISLYVKSPFILVTNLDLPAKTVPEFIKFAKQANPPLSYAFDRGGLTAAHVDGICQTAVWIRGNPRTLSQYGTARYGFDGGPRGRELR
jgi:tripartite-type tricarboxylate transporter receptor subunit TctC